MPVDKKITALVIFGILIAVLALFLPEQEDIAFEVIVNNTNLAPTQHGIVGTGERLNNTDYYANDSALQIFLYAHTNETGQWANIDLYINDTAVLHSDHSQALAGEIMNTSISAIIPKGAKYKASFTSIHHFEWREYPIISGRNGTLILNQTIVSNDIAFEYVVNNTDLYNHGRITGVNYTANDSAIQLFLIFHVVGTGASLAVDTNLSINGTVVEDRDYRTTAGAGIHEHFSITAHIPKGARYNVTNSSDLETLEWREYPILSGRNGTLSINMTGGTGSQNLSQVLTQGNQAINQTINYTSTSGGKWVTIGYDAPNDLIAFTTSQIMYYKQGSTFLGFTGSGFAYSAYSNRPVRFGESATNNSAIQHNVTHGTRWQGSGTGGANNNLNITGFNKVNMYQYLDMNNNNITNLYSINDAVFMPSSKKFWVNKINNYSNASGGYYPGAVSNNDLFSFIFNSPQPDATHNLISFEIVANLDTEWNYFLAKGARGDYNSTTRNATNLTALQAENILLRFGVSGFDNTSGWSGTKAYIDFRVEDTWNATWQPVKMDFFTTNASGSATNKRFTIWANGSIQNYGLGGVGNAYKCVDSKGIEYRGNPGC